MAAVLFRIRAFLKFAGPKKVGEMPFLAAEHCIIRTLERIILTWTRQILLR